MWSSIRTLLGLSAFLVPPALAFWAYRSLGEHELLETRSGLLEGQLQGCPPDSDCVVSEGELAQLPGVRRVLPLELAGDPEADFEELLDLLQASPTASLVAREGDYARFLVLAPLLELAHEIELRLDREQAVAHVRAYERLETGETARARRLVSALREEWGARSAAAETAP